MKKLLIVLALVSASSHAKQVEERYVDIQFWDTTIINTLGESEYRRKACTMIIMGPSEGELTTATFSGKTCKDMPKHAMAQTKEDGLGIYSMTLNGVEVMKEIKP